MSRVVVVKASSALSPAVLNKQQYSLMLSAGICLLTGDKGAADALHRVLRGTKIGIKTNCLTRKANSTPVALAEALSDHLILAGSKPADLIIWERSSRELSGAGYTLDASGSGLRCLGTDANGVGYSADFYTSGDVNSLVTRILTEMVEVNINLPVLKDHSVAGLSAGMKNMYGAINNPNKYHADGCNPFCAHVSNLPPLKSKNRLTIIDAVRVQYNGGPGFVPNYLGYYGGILISDDPVAVDRVGLEIVDHLRTSHQLPTLEKAQRPVKYLETAQQIGLGIADLAAIDLQVIEVDSEGRQRRTGMF